MGLADKLNQINPTFPGLPCGIARVLETLTNEEDKNALENIMNMRSYPIGISNRQIHEILMSEGYDVAFASVRLHRSKQCRCYVGKDSVKRRQVREMIREQKPQVEAKKKVASKRSSKRTKAGK
jgi:hypothetical protein